MNDLLSGLGIRFMVFQAPIGSAASPELAAAVSNAGGVGHVGCAWRSSDELIDLFAATARLTSKPFGANFVVEAPIEDELNTALACGVQIFSFWGDASQYITRVKESGAIAIQVVGSIDDAKRAADAGFDLIVAQGREAGGPIRRQLGMIAFVPQVVDAVSPLPVLAAGGIADQRGVAAAIALGAVGVWVGTRFLAAHEANIHPSDRQLMLLASGEEALDLRLSDIEPTRSAPRAFRNATTAAWKAAGRAAPPRQSSAHRSDSPVYRYHSVASSNRQISGLTETMALYVGEGVGLVKKTESAMDIVKELSAGLSLPEDWMISLSWVDDVDEERQ